MKTPAIERLDAVPPDGYVVPSGVGLYRSRVEKGGPTSFVSWRKDPYTVAFLSALQDLVLNTPDGLSGDDRLVQFGVSQGLSLAATMMSDPSVLWPEVFGAIPGAPKKPKAPSDDFGTSIDDALDGKK